MQSKLSEKHTRHKKVGGSQNEVLFQGPSLQYDTGMKTYWGGFSLGLGLGLGLG